MVAVAGAVHLTWNPILPPGVTAPIFAAPTPGGVHLVNLPGVGPGGPRVIGIDKRKNHRVARNAAQMIDYGERFWRNHWHIQEQFFPLGNIVSEQVRTFYVHNAHRTPEDITGIVETGATGVTLVGGSAPPFEVASATTIPYTITVSPQGPGTLDYEAAFSFDPVAGTLSVFATGSRIVLFGWEPTTGVGGTLVERWGWNTDIIENADGSEQRNSMRDIPAQEWVLKFFSDDELRNMEIENLLYGWLPNTIALPIFPDETELTVATVIGTNTITVGSTVDRGFVEGQDVVVFQDKDVFETQTIDVGGITATTLTFQGTMGAVWPAGTAVFPVQFVKAESPRGQNWSNDPRDIEIVMRNELPVDYADESGFTLYKGTPIWEDAWLTERPMAREWDHGLIRNSPPTGRFNDRRIQAYPKLKQSQILNLNGRTEWWRLKRWLHARRGQQKVFWISSKRKDFQIESVNDTTNLDILPANYSDHIFINALSTRREIEIVFNDGTIDRRTIIAATNFAPDRETLTLDSATTFLVTPANVARVSYLYKVRLFSDELDFVHNFRNNGQMVIPILEVVE